MSINPEMDRIVALPVVEPEVAPTNGHVVEVETVPAPVVPAPETQVKVKRGRPRWLASAAVGVVAIFATGSLGYTSYAASQQRDATQRQLAATQATLTAAQADAARRKLTADYVGVYIADSGKVQLDYQNFNCNSFGECRTAAQQLLTDLQAFQADRKSAKVPSDLAGADADLGDALSAAIAGAQEVISGMDNFDVDRFKEGSRKVDAAMLNVAKAQVALGNHLKSSESPDTSAHSQLWRSSQSSAQP